MITIFPTHPQGIKLLGTPLGHADFVQRKLAEKIDEHRVLFHRIPQVSDLQCAWLLLLFCAALRANHVLRVVHPALSFQFAVQHDVGIRQCLQDLLHVEVTQGMWEMAGLPFASGGLCLRNAERLRTTAYWASWADTLPMIRPRHPDVADHMVLSLSHGRGGFHLEGAAECRDRLVAVGIDAPEWGDVDCAVPGTPDVIWEDRVYM